MKKILIVAVLVVGGVSFGRDFEYRERSEVQLKEENQLERTGRYAWEIWDIEMDSPSEEPSAFFREMDTQSRGHEGR